MTAATTSRLSVRRLECGQIESVGIVMHRYQLDTERAFEFLVRTSNDSDVKLREVARQIIDGRNRRTRPDSPDSSTD